MVVTLDEGYAVDFNRNGVYEPHEVQATNDMMRARKGESDLDNSGSLFSMEAARVNIALRRFASIDLNRGGQLSASEVSQGGGGVWMDTSPVSDWTPWAWAGGRGHVVSRGGRICSGLVSRTKSPVTASRGPGLLQPWRLSLSVNEMLTLHEAPLSSRRLNLTVGRGRCLARAGAPPKYRAHARLVRLSGALAQHADALARRAGVPLRCADAPLAVLFRANW